jgi:hypothetical protein
MGHWEVLHLLVFQPASRDIHTIFCRVQRCQDNETAAEAITRGAPLQRVMPDQGGNVFTLQEGEPFLQRMSGLLEEGAGVERGEGEGRTDLQLGLRGAHTGGTGGLQAIRGAADL